MENFYIFIVSPILIGFFIGFFIVVTFVQIYSFLKDAGLFKFFNELAEKNIIAQIFIATLICFIIGWLFIFINLIGEADYIKSLIKEIKHQYILMTL
jgi:predicted PurR-regulated permease PerM